MKIYTQFGGEQNRHLNFSNFSQFGFFFYFFDFIYDSSSNNNSKVTWISKVFQTTIKVANWKTFFKDLHFLKDDFWKMKCLWKLFSKSKTIIYLLVTWQKKRKKVHESSSKGFFYNFPQLSKNNIKTFYFPPSF